MGKDLARADAACDKRQGDHCFGKWHRHRPHGRLVLLTHNSCKIHGMLCVHWALVGLSHTRNCLKKIHTSSSPVRNKVSMSVSLSSQHSLYSIELEEMVSPMT